MRAAAFVSGGLIPLALRGTSSDVAGHIADWCFLRPIPALHPHEFPPRGDIHALDIGRSRYSTICVLAGASPKDDSPIKPLPVDPSDPTKDIYANGAFPVRRY